MDPSRNRECWDNAAPLAEAGIAKADVDTFWASQPFDLQLLPHEGNCDLCFLKGYQKKLRIIEDRPDLAAWWIEREREIGAGFRRDQPSYEDMLRYSQRQQRFDFEDEPLIDCMCGD